MKKSDHNPTQVDAYMALLDYPLKAEVQAVRDIIKRVNKQISEQIKWNAPSFSYKGYLATFNFYDKTQIRLIFHNGAILTQSAILEGSYPDRRIVYFAGMKDVKAKKAALQAAVREWIKLMDKQQGA